MAGDLVVKRKVDKVILVRHPDVVLATLTPEDAIAISAEMQSHASVILQATAKDE